MTQQVGFRTVLSQALALRVGALFALRVPGALALLCLLACGNAGEHPQEEPSPPAYYQEEAPMPADSLAEALLRIQLAEAYRARYYVLNAGATASPPEMDAVYREALSDLGTTPERVFASYRYLLLHDPQKLQAVYDTCRQKLQDPTLN